MISTSPVRSCWFCPISFMVTSSAGRETLGHGSFLPLGHTSVTKPKTLVLISTGAHTSVKTRFENMLMATWDGSDKI